MSLLKGEIWRQTSTQAEQPRKDKGRDWGVKEQQRLPANPQKLGERHGTDSPSEGTNPANTLTLDL